MPVLLLLIRYHLDNLGKCLIEGLVHGREGRRI